jgi:hypothetical protein
MRFLIQAERDREPQGWEVTITRPPGSPAAAAFVSPPPRHMGVLDAGLAGQFPAPAGCEGPHHELCRADVETLSGAYEEIAVRREPASAEAVAQFGRYLFDALLGETAWAAIRAAAAAERTTLIELALAWDPAETPLHRMNWELLHDGQRFLVEGSGRTDVTITRVVLGAGAHGRTLDRPPRLLFAIGTSPDDPEVLPGVETIGLLANLEAGGLAVRARILDPASPDRLAQAVAEFRPDAVHLICHGELAAEGAVLALPSDERDRPGLERRDALQVLQLLRAPARAADGPGAPPAGGELPQLVVLSACHTGPTLRLFAGHESAPLAARLVQGGVPVVLGMAGQVSDLTSRLFARGFGRALLGGASLVEASAEARRLGLARSDRSAPAVDWAFPAVFMSAAVDPDWRPVGPELGEEAHLVNGWISRYQVDMKPVFCGRTGFLDAFWDMLQPDGRRGPRVLAVCAAGATRAADGIGRTRLLQELTRQALLAGHVPLLIGDKPKTSPRTLPDFSKALAGALTLVRSWLGLASDPYAQLNLLLRHAPGEPPDERLDPTIRTLLDIHGDAVPETVQLAASTDLGRLAAAARAAHPHVARANGRAVLLIDDVDASSVDLLYALHERLLGDHGLGTQEEPVPVVLALTFGGEDNLLRDIAEGRSNRPWRVMPLRPFRADGEDLLAYEQVMLHPFNPGAHEDVSNRPWVFNRSLDRAVWNDYVSAARSELGGWPSVFIDGTLYRFLRVARIGISPFVKDADDRALLEAFRQELGDP